MFNRITKLEHESTIVINIDTDEDIIFSDYKEDLIFLYPNNVRISSRNVESKIQKFIDKTIVFKNNFFVPIRRTISEEVKKNINALTSPFSIIYRKYKIINGCRLSLNHIINKKGSRYNISCEVEYDHDTKIEEIMKKEDGLIDVLHDYIHLIKLDDFKLEKIYESVVPKLQAWHNFDSTQPFSWAYKWNGVKGKFVSQGDFGYLAMDASDIIKIDVPKDLFFLNKLCLQIELLDDYFIIVEVLSIFYNHDIYTNEPITNLKCLKYLKSQVKDSILFGRKVVVQEYKTEPLPKLDNYNMYDGFIFLQNNQLIKWKYPTIDIKIINNEKIKLGDNVYEFKNNLDVNCVYELTPNGDVLRKRFDRITCSSEKEYQCFLKSVMFLNKN